MNKMVYNGGVSDYLFAKLSFLTGWAKVFDLFAGFDRYNISATPQEADFKAIFSDWKAVGIDIRDKL